MKTGWIGIVAGGAPKQSWVKLEGSRAPQWITPVFNTHDECSLYWFNHSPDKAWGVTEIDIEDTGMRAFGRKYGGTQK